MQNKNNQTTRYNFLNKVELIKLTNISTLIMELKDLKINNQINTQNRKIM